MVLKIHSKLFLIASGEDFGGISFEDASLSFAAISAMPGMMAVGYVDPVFGGHIPCVRDALRGVVEKFGRDM